MSEYTKVKIQEDDDSVELAVNVVGVVVAVAEHDNLPFAKAVPVLPDDDGGGGGKPMAVDATTTTPNHRRMIRVVAPASLPPGYRLTVQTKDATNSGDYDMFDVIVPERGVRHGQEFEAPMLTPPVIEGTYSNELCDCCTSNVCVEGWFCHGLVFGAVLERLHLDWLANPGYTHKETYRRVAIVWSVFVMTYILHFIIPAFTVLVYGPLILLVIIQTKTRMAFRQKYKIPGECFADCCTVYWCSTCAAIQMHRHMKACGHPPRSFKHWAEGEVIV